MTGSYSFRGVVTINDHCEFSCEELENVPQRTVLIAGEPCQSCLTALMRLAPRCAFQLKDVRGASERSVK